MPSLRSNLDGQEVEQVPAMCGPGDRGRELMKIVVPMVKLLIAVIVASVAILGLCVDAACEYQQRRRAEN